MKKENKVILAKEWFRRADDDEMSCEAILQEKGAASTLCFLTHQIAEKYLKGLLVYYSKEIEKSHDLIRLAHLLAEILPSIKKYNKELTILNRYYIETRYPGDWPEGFSWPEAEAAFKISKGIKKFVLTNTLSARLGSLRVNTSKKLRRQRRKP